MDRELKNMLNLQELSTKEKTYLYGMVDTIHNMVGLNTPSYEAFPSLKLDALKVCFEVWSKRNPAPDSRKIKVIQKILQKVSGK